MIASFNQSQGFKRPQATPLQLFCLWIISLFPASDTIAQTMDNPNFAAAMAEVEQGQWQKAQALLNGLITQNPSLHRARLELGLVYIRLGKPKKAKYHFLTLLNETNVPEVVKHNILQLLPEIDAQIVGTTKNNTDEVADKQPAQEHMYDGSFQLGLGYDDNVRHSSADYFLEDDPFSVGLFLELEDGSEVFVSPDGFVYDIDGNLLFENDGFVDLGNPDRSNAFAEAKLTLNHQYAIPAVQDISWHNSLSLQATQNQDHTDYNRLQARIDTRFSWRTSEQWKWSVQAHYRQLQRDGKDQIHAYAIDPELTYFNPWGSWSLGLQWMRRKYQDSIVISGELESFYPGFTNTIRAISAKWSKLFFDTDLLLLAKFELSDSSASDGFDYKGTRLTLASVYNLNQDCSLMLSASRLKQDYSEVSDFPLHDDSTALRTRLSYALTDSTELFLAGERALRQSDVYGGIKSDKSQWQLGFEMAF